MEIGKEEQELLIISFKEIDLSKILKEALNNEESIEPYNYIQGFMDLYSKCYYIEDSNDQEGMDNFVSSIGFLRYSINEKRRNNTDYIESYVSGFNDCMQLIAPMLYISKMNTTDQQ